MPRGKNMGNRVKYWMCKVILVNGPKKCTIGSGGKILIKWEKCDPGYGTGYPKR